MKNKTWIIVLIMSLALIISLAYSIRLRIKVKEISEREQNVVSKSIVQITASNVTIKNVVTIKGNTQKIINTDNMNDESYQIKIKLTYDEVAKRIKEGQEAKIKIEKQDKKLEYIGKITKIENIDNEITAIVDFNFDSEILTNMDALCTFVTEEAEDVIALPLKAVKIRNIGENEEITQEEKYVIVVDDDGSTREVTVKTGVSDGAYVEIVSGLSEGQKVQLED